MSKLVLIMPDSTPLANPSLPTQCPITIVAQKPKQKQLAKS